MFGLGKLCLHFLPGVIFWQWLSCLTVISLVCTAVSIHTIGSTSTAILGALEPVTALFFGVMIFGERLTPRLMLGILMILVAVTFIVVGKPLMTFLKEEVAGGMKRKLTR